MTEERRRKIDPLGVSLHSSRTSLQKKLIQNSHCKSSQLDLRSPTVFMHFHWSYPPSFLPIYTTHLKYKFTHNYGILLLQRATGPIFPLPPLLSSRKHRSLKNPLVRSIHLFSTQSGILKSSHWWCNTCPYIENITTIKTLPRINTI